MALSGQYVRLLQGPTVREAAVQMQANATVVRAQVCPSPLPVGCDASAIGAALRAGDGLTKQGLPKADHLWLRVCRAVVALCHYPEALVRVGAPDS